jgi:hypothetical protein
LIPRGGEPSGFGVSAAAIRMRLRHPGAIRGANLGLCGSGADPEGAAGFIVSRVGTNWVWAVSCGERGPQEPRQAGKSGQPQRGPNGASNQSQYCCTCEKESRPPGNQRSSASRADTGDHEQAEHRNQDQKRR